MSEHVEQKFTTFETFLSHYKVKDIIDPNQRVIVVDSNAAPSDAFQMLLDRGIQSAPVRNIQTHEYTGFLDVRDLVPFLLLYIKEHHVHKSSSLSTTKTSIHEIMTIGTKMYDDATKGITVSYLSRMRSFNPVNPDDSLLSVAKLLGQGVRRVPVVQSGKVIQIISQSTFMHFVHQHMKDVGTLLDKTISEAKAGTAHPTCVSHETPALDVFTLMSQKGLSGLGVLSEKQLVGNTSASDIKLLLQHLDANLLNMPIFEYLCKVRQEKLKTMAPVVVVKPSDTLAKLIGKLHATRLHRVFVVDEHRHPLEVVSVSDLMRYFLRV